MSLVQQSLKIFRLSFCHWIQSYLDQKKTKNKIMIKAKPNNTKPSPVILHHCWTSLVLLDKIGVFLGFVFGCFGGVFCPAMFILKPPFPSPRFPRLFSDSIVKCKWLYRSSKHTLQNEILIYRIKLVTSLLLINLKK